ncbi:hypothetical protein QR680_009729 [Steinernema hermaphroditum]|uniref:Carboxylesterase type B domain-containing protein n=1 Tax=Steinernema hermaphroditum TaxID=289476 RepID=A0AA39ILF9_9BILA|nr:hypothetical protein QR680_009729 [Steinernema hermaphroditum]
MFSPFSLIFLFAFFTKASGNPVVKTPFGEVEGFEYNTGNVFLGIRYGKAPVGNLRFEKPQKVDEWKDTLRATDFGHACFQTRTPVPNYANLSFSEDCLMMNIMTPKAPPPTREGYPVLFYIHGGGFEYRSATELGYKLIVDNFISRGIAVVTFSYRLGPLGFLTTGDDILAGNLGLWDQKLAMDFAHELLPSFGANVKEITIAGVSAGSASVSAFTLSPHTNTLFQRAIQISGSMFATYSIDDRTDSSSLLFFDAIGCRGSSKEILKCLKEKDVGEFEKTAVAVGGDYYQVAGVRYHPRLDYDFFPSDFHTLIRNGPKIPSIIGLTDAEMGLSVFDKSNGSAFAAPNYSKYTLDDFRVSLKRMAFHQDEVYEHLAAFYATPTESEADDPLFPIRKHLQIASDLSFVIPTAQEVIEKLKNDWPVYLYLEDYYSNLPVLDDYPIKGAYHANEMIYVFGLDQPLPIVGNEDDLKFRDVYVKMMADFIESGEAKVQEVQWDRAEKGYHRFMHLNLESEMKEEGYFEESVRFWTENIVKKVSPEMLKHMVPVVKQVASAVHDHSEF